MQKVIISDTSCLILLQNIGELELLFNLFGTITTTNEVAAEFGLPLPAWIKIESPKNKKYQSIVEVLVDKGEASTIALAIENENSLLIVDDLKARKFAQNLGIKVTGTMGIIVEAKLAGVIPSVKPLLKRIRQTNFRITQKLELLILKKAGEQ
jgi:predicted nucleic acid-binding protein